MNCKILVLTPTNKAADVLVRRIMEVSGDNHSYEEWLVRFGATVDEEIEKKLSGITCGMRPTSCGDQLAKAVKEKLGGETVGTVVHK